MNLYCIKCLKFTRNKNINIKRELDGKSNLIFAVLVVVLKIFKTADKEEISDLLKV